MRMRNTPRILSLLFVCLLLATHIQAQQVSAYVDSTSYLVGDDIHLKVRADVEEVSTILDMEVMELDSSGLELIKIEPWKATSKNKVNYFESEVVFIGFDPGTFFIPRMEVIISKNNNRKRLYTNEIPIAISNDSLITEELAPNKDIHREGIQWQDFMTAIYIFLILAVLTLLYFFWRKRRSKTKEQTVEIPPIPADEWAMNALNELEEKRLWQKGDIKAFYSELSEILRGYMEKDYHILALEWTTREILLYFRKQKDTQFPLQRVREILQVSDMVKFAKFKPEEIEHDVYFNKTKALIQTLIDQTTNKRLQELAKNEEE